MPVIVWVEFDEGTYTGPSFFADNVTCRNWVPIKAMTAYGSSNGSDVACCRMNVPLKLSWSFTPWKVQGQTIRGKVVANLGKTERSPGLSYVVFSCVRCFICVAVDDDLTWDCLTSKITSSKKFCKRVDYEKEVLIPKSLEIERRYNDSIMEMYI